MALLEAFTEPFNGPEKGYRSFLNVIAYIFCLPPVRLCSISRRCKEKEVSGIHALIG